MNNKSYAKKIIEQYSEKKPSKLDELKSLDNKVKKPIKIFSYIYGAASSLIFGTGMCLAMEIIGSIMPVGIVVGIIGMGMMLSTYPIYQKVLAKRKQKYGKEIIAKSNEIINYEEYNSSAEQEKTAVKYYEQSSISTEKNSDLQR